MEGNSHSSGVHQVQVVAPFVAKTYEMVSNPRTDMVIRWGSADNSFIVLDHTLFSHVLLPTYFKHSNFSSFIRQLNTYGFRKVDPDRWEFAHKSFLHGQTHLLPLIVRRTTKKEDSDDNEDTVFMQEVEWLRREQQALEGELQDLSKRLKVTERKPQQMMSFLSRVAEDPDFLPRIINSKQQQLTGAEKSRLLVSPPHLQYPANSLPITTSHAGVVAVPPASPSEQDGSQPIISPEFKVNEYSSPAIAPGFPFSILGEGFFWILVHEAPTTAEDGKKFSDLNPCLRVTNKP